jgi:flagellar protein FliO/FliZ
MDFLIALVKVVFSLAFILCLIYISFKFGGGKLQEIQNGRFVKILDRVPLSKDNSIIVLKIGERAYTVSSTLKGVEIINELEQREIEKLEELRAVPQYAGLKEAYNHFMEKRKINNNDKK